MDPAAHQAATGQAVLQALPAHTAAAALRAAGTCTMDRVVLRAAMDQADPVAHQAATAVQVLRADPTAAMDQVVLPAAMVLQARQAATVPVVHPAHTAAVVLLAVT